jgi:hypothetical protein
MPKFNIEDLKEQYCNLLQQIRLQHFQALQAQLFQQITHVNSINNLSELKTQHLQLIQNFRDQGIYDLEMEIQQKVIEFDECPICFKTYDQLYPSNKIAIVANCICVVCKDCLRTWFNNSEKCTKETKFCPICFKIVRFTSDSRDLCYNITAKKSNNVQPFTCDLSEFFN